MLLKGNGVGTVRRVRVVLVFGLLVVGCRGDLVSSTSGVTVPETSSATVVETTTTSTTVVTVPEGFVGDPAVIEEQLKSIRRGMELSPEDHPEGALDLEIPWPDNTNPDPVVALREIWEFDAWVVSTLPYDRLATIYLAADSPAWREAGELVEQLFLNGWIVEFDGPGFVWVSGGLGELSDVPSDVVVPVGGVVVRYRSSQSDVTFVRVADDSVVKTGTGYGEEDLVAVLVPSPLGWQVYWYGEPAS